MQSQLKSLIGKEMAEKLDHPVYETRFSILAKNYLKTYFVFEFLACAPVFLYEVFHGFTGNQDAIVQDHIESSFYQFLFHLKLFKLLTASKVIQTMKQLVQLLKDNLSSYRTFIHNAYRMIYTIVKTSVMVHILVCMWIYIILHYFDDPSIPIDTIETLKFMDTQQLRYQLYAIYSNNMYFMVTTTTTVGYGDNKAYSKLGRVYMMLVQFVGIVIFTEYQ